VVTLSLVTLSLDFLQKSGTGNREQGTEPRKISLLQEVYSKWTIHTVSNIFALDSSFDSFDSPAGSTGMIFSGGTLKYPSLGSDLSVASATMTRISVHEPSSILGFLALGTLGAASTLKRKLKSSKSSEKQTEKVS
jgi:hypothetical protein